MLALGGCTTTGGGGNQISTRSCDTSFRVVNQSNSTVREVYFSHASLNGWGVDQLGERVLQPGQSLAFRAANTGRYDFRVVWANGRASELRQIDICRAAVITVTPNGLRAT
ncbi:hypothetical protein ACQW02_09320 [Humitalea sp. 24SJ18S-53]|uniref:hypothetical protein n=1 Tax=Humitalea sp. 24SJ18S-53 TaxID=3422307 RepID=UPI003D66AACD